MKYLISYFFDTGRGRLFITTDTPINTEARVLEIEAQIEKQYRRSSVGLDNIILLEEEP